MAKAKDYMRAREDTRRRDAVVFKPGDFVWLSTKGITMPWDKERKAKKFTARYYGPFRVVKQTSPVTYELNLPAASNIHPIMHVSLLKPWVQGSIMDAPPLPDAKRDAEEYEIESILAHRNTKGGEKKYLVKWKGYTFEECTWEPAKNFKSHTLRDYHAKRKADKDDESASEDEAESLAVMTSAQRAETFPRSCKNGAQPMDTDADPHQKPEAVLKSPATGTNMIPIPEKQNTPYDDGRVKN